MNRDKQPSWQERLYKLFDELGLDSNSDIYTREKLAAFIAAELELARSEEREFCKQLYIDGCDWMEWGITDLEASENFEEEYKQALSEGRGGGMKKNLIKLALAITFPIWAFPWILWYIADEVYQLVFEKE